MKDSQQWLDETAADSKYIKVNNERFSTGQKRKKEEE